MTDLRPAPQTAGNSPVGFAAVASQHGLAVLKLLRCESGVTIVEFALMLPILLVALLMGGEMANYASARLQLNQIAISIADNASRIGQTDNSGVSPTVTEQDIDSVMFGAMKQGGSLHLKANGRVILSSLEKDPTTGRQYLHWQRC